MADYIAGRQGQDISKRNDYSNTDLLLHPELLSRDFIQLVLHERNIGEGGGRREASRDRLTDLYLQHVIPLPQRDLPDSRWGRRAGQNRPRPSTGHAHRVMHSSGGENARKRPLIVFDGSSGGTGAVKLKKPESGFGTDRLKPPPAGNLANPIRKLSGPPASPAGAPVGPPGSANRSPAGNGRPGSLASSSPPAVATAAVTTATVRVKRQATQERECDSSGEVKSPEAKRKIQHVTWP